MNNLKPDGGVKTSGGKHIKGFSFAGEDRNFVWANAIIEGNSVILLNDAIDLPVAVQYVWADNPECNLINGSGLPAVPFRTDDWPGLTIGKK